MVLTYVIALPKEFTIFRFELHLLPEQAEQASSEQLRKPIIFEIHGSQMQARAPDRANKKFRMHIDPDL